MYYVVIVQNNETQSVYRYSTYNEALAAYHAELAYRAEDRTSTKCAILDENLCSVRQEVYTKPVDNEEPQEG